MASMGIASLSFVYVKKQLTEPDATSRTRPDLPEPFLRRPYQPGFKSL